MSVPQLSSYTSSGVFTWTKPAGAKTINVLAISGGGGGKLTYGHFGSGNGPGPDGDPGSVLSFSFPANSISDSVQVNVGAGGAGCSGGNGGLSAFGNYLIAPGGVGGGAFSITATIYQGSVPVRGWTINGVTYGSNGLGGNYDALVCSGPNSNGSSGAVFITTE